MKVLHAVFHRALVGAELVVAAQHQRLAASVHAQGQFVVFDTGFHVGGLLRFDEIALESADFFGVEKLHHVQGFVRPLRMQRADHQRMRIPLDHDVRVAGEPDGAVFGRLAVAVLQHHVVPFLIDIGAGFAQLVGHAHRLH